MTINETPPSENEQLREKLRAALATLDTMEVTLAAKEVTLADTRKELAAAQEMLAVTEVTLVAARNLAGSEKHLIEQQQQRQQEQGINVMDLIASVEDEIDSQRDEVKVFAASPAIVKGDSVGLVLVFEKSASATKQTGQAEQKEQAVPSVHDVTYKIWFATCQDVTAKQAEILKRESWKLVYEHVLQDVNDWVDLRSAFAHIAEELPIEEIKLQTANNVVKCRTNLNEIKEAIGQLEAFATQDVKTLFAEFEKRDEKIKETFGVVRKYIKKA